MPKWWSQPDSRDAFVLAWVGILIEVAAAVTGLVIFASTGSALILCYGLENCVDFLASVVVLWRFYCPHALTAEVEEKLRHREKRASIAISFILFLLGSGITATAIHDFVNGAETPDELRIVLGISFVSLLIFGLLTIIKFHFSVLLESASLRKDGICSLIGTILSGALLVNTIIIDHQPNAWWIDPAVALGCGIASIIIGLYAVCAAACVQKLPICSPRWWFLSQGDGKDEITGRPLEQDDFIPGETEMTERGKPETSDII
jgi:divalent metal cation (Fe/Co/Zn/Cd) transporter